jgi:crotonobetainyl-CoA:carnitine CoA-transferase CaiB-like acyl-CoA transferase
LTASSSTSDINGPLTGIKVLDWTIWQFGPVSTSMMGDMGADVIKIESLDGDPSRGLARASSMKMNLGEGRIAYFETCNRNKRSIAVDLKTEPGRQIIYDLCKESDVFVQNFRSGVAERLGLGYEKLRKINSKLIYGSANGYGPFGPDANQPSFDGCGQARSGLMMSATQDNQEYPTQITQGVSDQIGGIMLCQGILAALVSRSIKGVGQKVETSHLSANMWLQGLGVTMSLLQGGAGFSAYNRTEPVNPLSNVYRTSDGRFIMMMHLQPDPYWEPLLEAMELPQFIADPRYNDMVSRSHNSAEVVALLDKRFIEKTAAEWDATFRAFPTDFIYSLVQTVQDLPYDPQVIANDFITKFDHPVLGEVQMCNHPSIYSETPAGIWKEAPEVGQHTEQILVDELGYSWDDIARLQKVGTIL